MTQKKIFVNSFLSKIVLTRLLKNNNLHHFHAIISLEIIVVTHSIN